MDLLTFVGIPGLLVKMSRLSRSFDDQGRGDSFTS